MDRRRRALTPAARATRAATVAIPAAFLALFVAWPLVGLVTSAPLGAALGLALTVALGTWAAVTFEGERRLYALVPPVPAAARRTP